MVKFIRNTELRPYNNQNNMFCIVECPDCGTQWEIPKIRAKKTKRCRSCSNRIASKASQKAKESKIKSTYQNETEIKLNQVYYNMMSRCYRSANHDYHNYGGRGIKVCKEWKDDKYKFISWCLSNGWTKDLEIDRVDVNKDYSPNNCRFVTHQENSASRRPKRR